MTDEKMIEEMAKDLKNIMIKQHIGIRTALEDNYQTHYAEAIVKAGYRKIPKNAVVLTKEEHKQWLKDCIESNKVVEERTRKETAKEIRNKFRELLSQYCEKMTRGFAFKILDETIKQCGVEVEEL